ncbi:endoribonuclease ZC3H12A [Caerostris darwini]|uniref:Endoribonuclease ZC3H12A n=1 Tax=Caerostris darwini TaxID=1538125 RepID=A0AAV4NBR6_9ARAC|nr:endoribonuclease ZC3H12A [Caerostris darwini]
MQDSKKRKIEPTLPLPNFIPLNSGKNQKKNKFVSRNRRKRKGNAKFIPQNNEKRKEITKSAPLNSEENINFIPLNNVPENKMVESLHEKDDIIILDEIERVSKVPKLVPVVPRRLRPIVIDGSNVARAHGRHATFSCKGIKIAVDFFLKRGHEKVTAFVPEYRKFSKSNFVPTIDQSLLVELQNDGHLVFTPSRRVQDKCFSCYDDWFIVDLASKTGGVILSKDCFRDVIEMNEEFRPTVEERLLMFCFVGDVFMVPPDPLGKNGPTLEEFLSFPPSESPPT